jgi:uncharacterized membrane protein YtjA (UPF0391 family)
MLKLALFFFIISIIAGLFGFTGISAAAAGIAKVLFFIFIIAFVVFLIFGLSWARHSFRATVSGMTVRSSTIPSGWSVPAAAGRYGGERN